jgi:hypothetical protein
MMTDQMAVTPEPRVVQSLFRGLIVAPAAPKPARRTLAAWVAEKHGMTLSEMLAKTQKHKIAHARQEAMWVMHQHGYGDSHIAYALGLTPWTVTHGRKAHAKRVAAAMGSLEWRADV